MKLVDEEFARLKAHLESRTSGVCPMCGHDQWSLIGSATMSTSQWAEYRRAYPVYLVGCRHCFFVASFSKTRVDKENPGVTEDANAPPG